MTPTTRKRAALTESQKMLLIQIGRGDFVHGSKVRVARALERSGLVTLVDNGALGRGNLDDERWYVEPTDAGRAALRGKP